MNNTNHVVYWQNGQCYIISFVVIRIRIILAKTSKVHHFRKHNIHKSITSLGTKRLNK